MNKSDTERVAGMLDALGAEVAASQDGADIIVFMTCCVREAADERLYGQVASLKNSKALVAVGGCIGQRDGAELAAKMPHVGVVFGTHNIASLPALILEAWETKKPAVEIISNKEAAELEYPVTGADNPVKREHAWHAWLPIMTGCNNYCAYCVVPYVRGREKSMPFEEVLEETGKLVADGVREITLLGQNVNSYGRDLYGQPRFAELLYALGESGIERLRFATSHPKDLLEETIQAFGEVPALMPALHLPVQCGSDRILEAMNRRYTSGKYLELIEGVKAACKAAGKEQVAFSTDIIVGFPGETEADFEDTMTLVRAVGFAQAFTFIYSRREGTPAASLVDDTPREVIQERFDRLVELVQQSAWDFNQQFLDTEVLTLFEGASKRNNHMLAGRGPGNQTVHAPLPNGAASTDFAGKMAPVLISEAKTWYLRGTLL
ncbi:MAG: tRNA (N6-isopentenyl adenosine(37)-C2)-methylthiotransferase MiaB [Coriobacteriia bacterium]|nr:tRNA (N6-isopentenyl adenosine(37)-C2)-methylthiotransferase MiaB [Coriobacteriia bacterium]MCL2750195.1 tRNA (N6-isopentenyl adenosine(37)-C2)-methylthiotransferase MiaB [Coriobacteriia bacterium]